MRFVTTLLVLGLSAHFSVLYADGPGRGNGHAGKAQPVRAKADAPKAKAPAPKQAGKAATQPAKVQTRTARADAKAAKAQAKADRAAAKAARAEAKAVRKSGTTASVTTPQPAEITPTTPTTTHVKNPKLEARLQGMLPEGMSVQDAMAGFKNWGQFVAAVHVSNNLSIPFADLKTRMTGTPDSAPMSLGQAIQSLKGNTVVSDEGTLTATKIRSEVKKAEDAANTELRRTRDRS